MEEPQRPGAARETFAERITVAITQSGRPTLERIAQVSKTIPGGVELKRSTVSAWSRGRGLPDGPDALMSLLTVLEKIASAPGRFDRQEWHRHYRRAREEPPVESGEETREEPGTVRDFEPSELGVHRARTGTDESRVPTYVLRDIDGEIRAELSRTASTGGMVLLSGDSTAGKTRAAYEALRAVLPDALMFVPGRARDLGDLIGTLSRSRPAPGVVRVLWLDNLERYLASPGFDVSALRSLRRAGVVVLATIRLAVRQQYMASGVGADVLKSCREFAVERLWSDKEIARLKEVIAAESDSRLVEALQCAKDHGVAEYLAAGPELWRELVQASTVHGNPRGAAFVRAAIALALAGARMPVGMEVLERIHEIFLPGANKALLTPESEGEAVRWATEVRYGVTAPLLPDGSGFYPFDYLVDATLRESGPGRGLVPEDAWQAALDLVQEKGDRFEVALAAYMNDLPEVSKKALGPLVEAGDLGAIRGLGEMLRPSDPKEARRVLRRAVALGDPVAMRLMGNHFIFAGKYEKANKWFRRAAKAGDEEAYAYFCKPGVYNQPDVVSRWDALEWDEEDDTPWQPTPRTLAVLLANLEILGDMVHDAVEEAGDRRIKIKGPWHFVLDQLPSQTWRMGAAWRRNFVRCFDDLAADIRSGGMPSPRCTGEEMALHIALEHASAMSQDEPDLVERFVEGKPAEAGDYDWCECSELLFQGHDVLFLYDPWLSSVADPQSSLGQRMGVAYLQPEDWFEPFDPRKARDPARGYLR
ncbi:tetratricopeptide repeat protein [Kitasatospora sp. NPDC088134]|uniref:tetratricopeptide repeat protein n=1 Tax=Kitasatospora sp. NPDC088134 TaxID=3364071 RepID=UPI0037F672BC